MADTPDSPAFPHSKKLYEGGGSSEGAAYFSRVQLSSIGSSPSSVGCSVIQRVIEAQAGARQLRRVQSSSLGASLA
jgi:hypothetical protein